MTEQFVKHFLKQATENRASDVYIVQGKPVTLKISGRMVPVDREALTEVGTQNILEIIYRLGRRDFKRLEAGDDDFAIAIEDVGRFRVNAYRQKLSFASIIRTIPLEIPDPAKLSIPDVIMGLANYQRGLVLFTGTTGSGKSTSLACLIDKINTTRDNHIITIEDPIEFRHAHKRSIISQRELEADTKSYVSALRAAMRQVPDVILVGEMRDYDTISSAITAAETGHLVFSTLHTIGAAPTIDRIIDVFPPNQQNQIRVQLSITLQAVVSQQLIPTVDGKLHPAFEIMVVNSAIRNLIRENKTFQIENVLQTSANVGMRTMDQSLHDLYRRGQITRENALLYSVNQQDMLARLSK
ncbi:MAG: PilT/PilU family type 4a pilus ATPase [Clostridiales bacterium]|jgi:twitching motility protein PilT|nr:PilT/PilU family type 4a pilus ATPase [Clostridiales bacterium]